MRPTFIFKKHIKELNKLWSLRHARNSAFYLTTGWWACAWDGERAQAASVSCWLPARGPSMFTWKLAAEGGCFCNIRTGVCSVIFQEAIHLPFAWLMVPQRTNRKLNWKFGSVGGRRRPDLPKGIVLSGSEDDARDSFLLGNSLIFFLRDNIMPWGLVFSPSRDPYLCNDQTAACLLSQPARLPRRARAHSCWGSLQSSIV